MRTVLPSVSWFAFYVGILTLAFGFSACSGDTSGTPSGLGDSSDELGCDPEATHADFPFQYEIVKDELGEPQFFALKTEAGNIKMILGPWGAHSDNHTGHMGKDAKSNWVAWPSELDNETSLAVEAEFYGGNKDGVCDPGEICRMKVSDLEPRVPRYTSPGDGLVVSEIFLDTHVPQSNYYFGSRHQWRVETRLCQYVYTFGHVGWIGEVLRQAMIAQGDPDPLNYDGPTGVNLLSKPIVLAKNDEVAIPQIHAEVNTLDPTYTTNYPWAQMEVPTRHYLNDKVEPVFAWLPESVQEDLKKIIYKEMQNPKSFRYYAFSNKTWLWKAEAGLWTLPFIYPRGQYDSIYGNLGAWFEKGGSSCSGTLYCNQGFSIWKILKDNPIYDSSLYDSPQVTSLVMRSSVGGVYNQGELLSPLEPHETRGTLLVKWRTEDIHTLEAPLYQKISYAMDSVQKVLKLHWGPESTDRAEIANSEDPADPADLTCNGTSITCMGHEYFPNMPGY